MERGKKNGRGHTVDRIEQTELEKGEKKQEGEEGTRSIGQFYVLRQKQRAMDETV
jgi:hypothetical protein